MKNTRSAGLLTMFAAMALMGQEGIEPEKVKRKTVFRSNSLNLSKEARKRRKNKRKISERSRAKNRK